MPSVQGFSVSELCMDSKGTECDERLDKLVCPSAEWLFISQALEGQYQYVFSKSGGKYEFSWDIALRFNEPIPFDSIQKKRKYQLWHIFFHYL